MIGRAKSNEEKAKRKLEAVREEQKKINYTKNMKPLEKALSTSVCASSSSKSRKPSSYTAVSYYDDQDYKEVNYTKNQKPLEKALSTSVYASSSKKRKPNKG